MMLILMMNTHHRCKLGGPLRLPCNPVVMLILKLCPKAPDLLLTFDEPAPSIAIREVSQDVSITGRRETNAKTDTSERVQGERVDLRD